MALYTMLFVYHYTLLENKTGNPKDSDAALVMVCYPRTMCREVEKIKKGYILVFKVLHAINVTICLKFNRKK